MSNKLRNQVYPQIEEPIVVNANLEQLIKKEKEKEKHQLIPYQLKMQLEELEYNFIMEHENEEKLNYNTFLTVIFPKLYLSIIKIIDNENKQKEYISKILKRLISEHDEFLTEIEYYNNFINKLSDHIDFIKKFSHLKFVKEIKKNQKNTFTF